MSLYDIIVYSPDEHLVLIVEVKASTQHAPDQMERIRRYLMGAAETQNAPFFLLAQLNGLYLWKQGAAPGATAEFAPVKSVLRDYAASLANHEDAIRKPGLTMIVQAWLDDLALGIRQPKSDSEADQLLVRAGIYNQIRQGRVAAESHP